MRKKNKETIQFIPLKIDPERAIQLFIQMLKNYPFNSKHLKIEYYFNNTQKYQYQSKIWVRFLNHLYKLGDLNSQTTNFGWLSDIHNIVGKDINVNPIVFSQIIMDILETTLSNIDSFHTNWEYQETPYFVLLKDFFYILHSYLTPNGQNWQQFLNNNSIGYEFRPYYYPLHLKVISKEWKGLILQKAKTLLNEGIKFHLDNIGVLFKIHAENNVSFKDLIEDTAFSALRQSINNVQKHNLIPDEFQSSIQDIVAEIEFQIGINFNFPSQRSQPPRGAYYSETKEISFGTDNNFIEYYDYPRKEYEKYEYKLKPEVELILSPEQFRNQVNEILNLFFGNTNLQLDGDGVLRFQDSKYESKQIHGLIETFMSKKLSSLTTQLDNMIELEEKGDWVALIKASRPLFEDFLRLILKKKKIKLPQSNSLVDLLKKTRSNSKKIFQFPKWIKKDPFGYFDEFILNSRYLGVLLNPNAHTGLISVSKIEAISIKNAVVSVLISLAGFLK